MEIILGIFNVCKSKKKRAEECVSLFSSQSLLINEHSVKIALTLQVNKFVSLLMASIIIDNNKSEHKMF